VTSVDVSSMVRDWLLRGATPNYSFVFYGHDESFPRNNDVFVSTYSDFVLSLTNPPPPTVTALLVPPAQYDLRPGGLPDLQIGSVEVTCKAAASATVLNAGTRASAAFSVELWVDGGMVATKLPVGLDAGKQTALVFSGLNLGSGPMRMAIRTPADDSAVHWFDERTRAPT
jgi:hypothetical protein